MGELWSLLLLLTFTGYFIFGINIQPSPFCLSPSPYSDLMNCFSSMSHCQCPWCLLYLYPRDICVPYVSLSSLSWISFLCLWHHAYIFWIPHCNKFLHCHVQFHVSSGFSTGCMYLMNWQDCIWISWVLYVSLEQHLWCPFTNEKCRDCS